MNNPLDEYKVQLPGRLLALELVVTALLRRRSDPAAIMREASELLTHVESELTREGIGVEDDLALKIFAAAHASIETFERNTRKRPL